MDVFKIMLIILIAMPVVASGLYFYFQMINFIKERNRREQEFIRRGREDTGAGAGKSGAVRNKGRKSRKSNKRGSSGESRRSQ